MEDAVKEGRLNEYKERLYEFHDHDDVRHPEAYLVRECCEHHRKLDGKFPGLFKVRLVFSYQLLR